MKTLRIETGTEIRRAAKGELTSYPIQSVRGARGTGWIQRELPEDTIVIALDSVDGVGGGFAVSLREICQALHLIDLEIYGKAVDCVFERGEIINRQDKTIEALKKKLAKKGKR